MFDCCLISIPVGLTPFCLYGRFGLCAMHFRLFSGLIRNRMIHNNHFINIWLSGQARGAQQLPSIFDPVHFVVAVLFFSFRFILCGVSFAD